MDGGDQDMDSGDGQLLTGQDVAVTGGGSAITPFTPEQVAAARGYADASRGESTQAK